MSAGVNFSWGGIDVGTPGVGVGVLSRPGGGNARAAAGTSATPQQKAGRYTAGQTSDGGAPAPAHGPGLLATFIGLLGVAFLLWLVRRNSTHLKATTFGWNWYNGLSATLMVGIGFTILKLGANKVPPNPVSTLINAW